MTTLIIILIPVFLAVGIFYYWFSWDIYDTFVKRRQGADPVCASCHQVFEIPDYICPQCKTVHRDLTKTLEHGFFYHKCRCGKRLPRYFLLGRWRLSAQCPHCRNSLGIHSENLSYLVFPIVGGTSSGKTAFMNAMIVSFVDEVAKNRLILKFPFSEDETLLARIQEQGNKGIPPHKTSERNPRAFCMNLTGPKLKQGKQIYLYDPAGEVFEKDDSLGRFRYYDYMQGVLLLIDPFSIPYLNRLLADGLKEQEQTFQVCREEIENYYGRFINGLKGISQIKEHEIHNAACAVVLTKSDAFGLESRLGEIPRQNLMKKMPGLSREDAMDHLCREHLKYWGMGHLLELIDEQFRVSRCFSVSAFGHQPAPAMPFTPVRVLEPFLWLLNEASPDLGTLLKKQPPILEKQPPMHRS